MVIFCTSKPELRRDKCPRNEEYFDEFVVQYQNTRFSDSSLARVPRIIRARLRPDSCCLNKLGTNLAPTSIQVLGY